MALIECPECGKEISDKAEACPHCGNPLRAKPDVVAGRQVQTVERTAKLFKANMVLAVLTMMVAMVWIVGSCSASGGDGPSPWSLLTAFVGFIWYVCARIAAWWHHG